MHLPRKAIQDHVFKDALAEKENIFVGNISLGVMIFFAAGDPEGNCHEKCQQLGDGNGKPDTVRAEPQRKYYDGDDLKNNGLEERNY